MCACVCFEKHCIRDKGHVTDLLAFTRPLVLPKQYYFLSSLKPKSRYLAKCPSWFFFSAQRYWIIHSHFKLQKHHKVLYIPSLLKTNFFFLNRHKISSQNIACNNLMQLATYEPTIFNIVNMNLAILEVAGFIELNDFYFVLFFSQDNFSQNWCL